MKSWFFVLFLGAATFWGGCALFQNQPPVVDPCQGCPVAMDTVWVFNDTLVFKTDTIIQEDRLELWKLQTLLDSIGSTFTVGQPGDTARVVFVRGKDGVIIRTIIKPITVERIRRDTIRIQMPDKGECKADNSGWLAAIGVFGVMLAAFFVYLKRKRDGRV